MTDRASWDVQIPNGLDSDVITLSCLQTATGHPIADLRGSDDFASATRDGALIVLLLDEDEEMKIRIVHGEMTAQERDEWCGRAFGKLRIPDGKLTLHAAFSCFKDERHADPDEMIVHEVEPPRD